MNFKNPKKAKKLTVEGLSNIGCGATLVALFETNFGTWAMWYAVAIALICFCGAFFLVNIGDTEE